MERLSVFEQARRLAGLFALFGWDHDAALTAVDMVLRKLADAGARPQAYEQLRKEQRWRAMAGLPAGSWTAMLRILLGSPSEAHAFTTTGMGVLVRFLTYVVVVSPVWAAWLI